MSADGRAPTSRKRHWPFVVGGLAALVIGSIAFATLRVSGPNKADSLSSSTGDSAASTKPLAVLAVSPTAAATDVDYAAPITINFSTPLAEDTALPTLDPPVPGRWAVRGANLTFTPAGSYVPATEETITVPATVHANGGGELGTALQTSFTVEPGSIVRLQQLLAELDYLPVSFTPAGGPAASSAATALDAEPTEPALVSLEPQSGTFNWRFASIPSQLAANWTEGQWNVATQGAVIAFESDHNLTLDGEPGPHVWRALTQAVAARAVSPRPYDYLIVTETLPETLYVWRDGSVAFQTPVNTGVAAAPTPLGTWPVYLRFTSTTMRGTNPDGTTYADPGVPWVSYFHGSDAVHGFWRSSYGYPQSVGCVEEPIDAAATVYPYDPYGTLVTVTTGDLAPELGVSAPVSPPPAPPNSIPTAPTTSTTTTTTPLRHAPRPTTTTLPPTTEPPTTATTTTLPATTSTSSPAPSTSTTSPAPSTTSASGTT